VGSLDLTQILLWNGEFDVPILWAKLLLPSPPDPNDVAMLGAKRQLFAPNSVGGGRVFLLQSALRVDYHARVPCVPPGAEEHHQDNTDKQTYCGNPFLVNMAESHADPSALRGSLESEQPWDRFPVVNVVRPVLLVVPLRRRRHPKRLEDRRRQVLRRLPLS